MLGAYCSVISVFLVFTPAKNKAGLSNFLSRSINLFEVWAWEAEQVDTWGCLVQVQ